jgi:hypothetical protein
MDRRGAFQGVGQPAIPPAVISDLLYQNSRKC